MKTIDVNVIPEQVVKNTQLISKVGANVGTQIFKVEVRNAYPFATDQEFEAEKRKYETGEKKGFILNRSPRRLLAKNILIAGVCLVKDIDDELCLAINPKEDGSADMLLPVDNSAIDRLGKADQDAIKAAIRGFLLPRRQDSREVPERSHAEGHREPGGSEGVYQQDDHHFEG